MANNVVVNKLEEQLESINEILNAYDRQIMLESDPRQKAGQKKSSKFCHASANLVKALIKLYKTWESLISNGQRSRDLLQNIAGSAQLIADYLVVILENPSDAMGKMRNTRIVGEQVGFIVGYHRDLQEITHVSVDLQELLDANDQFQAA